MVKSLFWSNILFLSFEIFGEIELFLFEPFGLWSEGGFKIRNGRNCILEILPIKFYDYFLTARTSLEFYFLKNFEEILEF